MVFGVFWLEIFGVKIVSLGILLFLRGSLM